ncbi:MAG: hypothetical protein H5T59_07555 [Anaerolineae bacterium]|nr:hypothetical protein [Anaerolineae bacterium]
MWTPRRTRVTVCTTLRRERLLPEPGEVLVAAGDFVQAMDVVARLHQPSHLHAVDVARDLGLRDEEIQPYLTKELGEAVKAGEPVAVRRGALGLGGRVCKAPADGRLWRIVGRWLVLVGEPQPLEVKAYLRGRVVQVVESQGAVVETRAALVEGAWGTGGAGYGVLKVLAGPGDVLDRATVDISCRGSVVVCGLLDSAEALRELAQVQAQGLVVGSLRGRVLPALQEVGLPLVATEGFGAAPMNADAYALLAQHEGDEVSLLGCAAGLHDRRGPEVVIPVPEAREPEPEPPDELVLGARVRVLRGPHAGSVGMVQALPPCPQPVDGGQRWGARVRLEGDEDIFVPWNNLALMG